MSVKVSGTLIIKEVGGVNGKFCVGDLSTSIGEFKVKEAILDQFSEGQYTGEFLIDNFYLHSYAWRGKLMTEIRAKLADIYLDTADEGKVPEDQQAEPDPLNESGQEASQSNLKQEVEKSGVSSNHDASDLNPEFVELAKLFGDELTLKILADEAVKLDPTVDRGLFREQRDLLKKLGYQFEAMTQSWIKK